jgi:uncharacterized protein (DUF433 family)
MLAVGDTPETILEDYRWLEREDIQACLIVDRSPEIKWKLSRSAQ